MSINLNNLGFKTFLERLHKALNPEITDEELAQLWLGNDKNRTPGWTGYGTAVSTLTAMAEEIVSLRKRVAALEAQEPQPQPEPREPVFLRGPVMFLADEITHHTVTDRQAKAREIVDRLKLEGYLGVCLQIHPGDDRQPSNLPVASMLKQLCQERGLEYGTWDQQLPTMDQAQALALIPAYGSTFHACNPEGRDQERGYDLGKLKALGLPGGLGCVFTEAAFNDGGGLDKALARRWVDAGVVGIPEAILSENDRMTPLVAWDLAFRAGWPGELIAPCVYFTRGIRATAYDAEMRTGRIPNWSVWRYNGVNDDDFIRMRAW